MTSHGSAIVRFERALEIGRPSIVLAAARELPKPILLRDALRILLVLLDGEPERYAAAAARYGARLVTERHLSLAEAQLAYTTLTMLASPDPAPAAAALETLLEHHGERDAARHLGEWLRLREHKRRACARAPAATFNAAHGQRVPEIGRRPCWTTPCTWCCSACCRPDNPEPDNSCWAPAR